MSSDGWTPLFSCVFTGSMRGKPEELLVWFTLLGRKNSDGVVDCSYRCLAEDCGLPIETVKRCIAAFCQPDPESRSLAEGGAKLTPLPNRGFGWRVVNHSFYRERARKQRYNEEQTKSGADAERKRESRRLQSCPDVSGDVQTFPAIRSDQIRSDTDKSKRREDTPPLSGGSAEGETARKRASARARRMPKDYLPSSELRAWAAAQCPLVDFDAELQIIRDHEFGTAHTDWDATVRNWMRREQKQQAKRPNPRGQPPPRESRFEAMTRRLNGI